MSDRSIQHFVLTRFNIASPGRESDIRNRPGWLSRRFALFEKYCLPSMAAQTERRFEWIIYFDENTPEEFRDRIRNAQKVAPFEARFVGITRMSDVARDVVERIGAETQRVLTTRLDNDDAVSSDFVASIRAKAAECNEDTVLNFPHGVALRAGSIFTAYDESNPFTSLIESRDEVQTIWAAQHRDLGTKWNLLQINARPLWLQIVHGENVANRIKGRLVEHKTILREFAALHEGDLKNRSRLTLLFDNAVLYPLRTLREAGIAILRPLLRHFRK